MASTVQRDSVELNIEIDKGSTFRHSITWKVGPKGSELPVDLTGVTARMDITPSESDTVILHSMTTANAGLVLDTDPTTGIINMYIDDVTSTAFTFTRAVYNLEVYFPNGDVKRLLRGSFVAHGEIVQQ